jgi:subtilisin family serine protease
MMAIPQKKAAVVAALALMATSCGGRSQHAVPSAVATPTALNPLLCTSTGAPQSINESSAVAETLLRRPLSRAHRSQYAPGIVEIAYRDNDRAASLKANNLISGAHARLLGQISSADAVTRTQILSVDPAREQDLFLQSSPSVQVSHSVARYRLSTTAALTNDPYLRGFTPANTPPLYATPDVPGQWDFHEICAANAWAYANANTTGRTYSGASGGTVRVAVIDTGADITHPELSGRVVYQESVLGGIVTTTDMHDNDGHGTDVAGIIGAAGNNAVGFAGVAYSAPLMIFKIFPDPPPGGCEADSTDVRCSASGADVALAIRDAVSKGAKVINLSLGSPDPDTAEEQAVAGAIAGGVVVVAAAGNEGSNTLDYPAADPGVLAVGASALNDSNTASITDKVAAYSNYSVANASNWGIVAPGGEPASANDVDDLHWIENIYTSTAADGSSPSSCIADRGGTATDCRIFIAGTSQAAPHVSGAAALLLSVVPSLTPSAIKNLLCNSAIPVSGGHAGCGRLNVYRALAQAIGDSNP